MIPDGVERNHRLGQMQQMLHSFVSFFQGIEGCLLSIARYIL